MAYKIIVLLIKILPLHRLRYRAEDISSREKANIKGTVSFVAN